MEKVKDPCISVCQYDEKEICTGCQRTKTEAKTWWRMNEQEKKLVLENIKKRGTENTEAYDYYV